MMQEPIGIPACFSSHDKVSGDSATITRSGQSVFMSVYQTKVAGQCRLITVSWCKNLLLHGLSVSIEGPNGETQYNCKVELKPWYFWKKHGSSRFQVEGKTVSIFWDLRNAKFNGETEPQSDYYVAVVCENEAVLVLGDRRKDAYRKTSSRPALIEPILVSKKEHIFGKKKFSTRARFHQKGRVHEISIECSNNSSSTANGSSSSNSSNNSDNSSSSSSSNGGGSGGFEPEMEIKIDGKLAIHVKHLQWKFRGNESLSINKVRVEVYWDVHDWLFSPGLRHALFIFKPTSIPASAITSSPPLIPSSSSTTPLSMQTPGRSISVKDTHRYDDSSIDGENCSSGYSLFLYAWKVE
ncbi:hypothetical protein MKW94_029849 [Papaver nudicaule]|uniref:Uncharacterized protein n=1 Tax=Papaver nudicaule TaxID=74823 RepID=A0AA41UV02_PAPNU|nr:hypothetical protein [Papaver nudicaule]